MKQSKYTENQIQQDLMTWIQAKLDEPHLTLSDNFFDLGGQSLQALELCQYIEKKYHLILSPFMLARDNLGQVAHTIFLEQKKSNWTKTLRDMWPWS
jgi:acyl carrier protein